MVKMNASPSLMLCIALSTLMLVFTLLESTLFPLFSLYADNIHRGEIWRVLTANFVHFGWVHTLMNVAAFVLCCSAFFNDINIRKFALLLLWCSLIVGVGVYVFNPDYTPYAGLSGALHGLIVAGLIQTRAYPLWIRATVLALIAAKLVQENSVGYEATDLQQLIPAAVAVEAHLYGAIAGAVFAGGNWLITRSNRKA